MFNKINKIMFWFKEVVTHFNYSYLYNVNGEEYFYRKRIFHSGYVIVVKHINNTNNGYCYWEVANCKDKEEMMKFKEYL